MTNRALFNRSLLLLASITFGLTACDPEGPAVEEDADADVATNPDRFAQGPGSGAQAGPNGGSAKVFLTESKISELRTRIQSGDPGLKAYVSNLKEVAELSVGRTLPLAWPSNEAMATIRTGADATGCGDPAALVHPPRDYTIFYGLARNTTGTDDDPAYTRSDAKRVFTLALAYRLLVGTQEDEYGYGAEAVKILKRWMRHPDSNFKRVDPALAFFPDCVVAKTDRPSTETRLNKGVAIAPVAIMFAAAFDLLKNTPQLPVSTDPDSDFVVAREWFKNIVLEIEDSRDRWVGNYGKPGSAAGKGFIETQPANVGTNHMAWHNAAIYILSTQFSGALTSRRGILGMDGIVRDGASFTRFMPDAIFGAKEPIHTVDLLAWGRRGEIVDRYRGTRSYSYAPSYFSLEYSVHNLKAMLLLAEAARNFDGVSLFDYSDPQTGKSLRWAVEYYGRFLADYSPNENMRRNPGDEHDFVYDPWSYACIWLSGPEKIVASQRLRAGSHTTLSWPVTGASRLARGR
jgi:hypothetical protein